MAAAKPVQRLRVRNVVVCGIRGGNVQMVCFATLLTLNSIKEEAIQEDSAS